MPSIALNINFLDMTRVRQRDKDKRHLKLPRGLKRRALFPYVMYLCCTRTQRLENNTVEGIKRNLKKLYGKQYAVESINYNKDGITEKGLGARMGKGKGKVSRSVYCFKRHETVLATSRRPVLSKQQGPMDVKVGGAIRHKTPNDFYLITYPPLLRDASFSSYQCL